MTPAVTPESTGPVTPPSSGDLPKSTSENFASELRSFFVLCLLNLVFGALAMAFGLQFIVTAVLAMAGSGTLQWFPAFQVLLGWAAAVIGFRWILSSVKILKGVTKIRKEYRAIEGIVFRGAMREPPIRKTATGPVPAEALTGLIVRLMAHYRENWKTIWRMNLISTLGGGVFLALGVVNIVEGIQWWYSPNPGEIIYLPALIPLILAVGIDLAIGIASLRSSFWFRRYARAWDHRLIEASRIEEALKHSMENR